MKNFIERILNSVTAIIALLPESGRAKTGGAFERASAGILRPRAALPSVAVLAAFLAIIATAIIALYSPPAGAQQPADASQVSVSNLAETDTVTRWCSARSDWKCAQGFTTGGNADGYTLTSVTGRFLDKAGNPGDVPATLHAAASSSVNDQKAPGQARMDLALPGQRHAGRTLAAGALRLRLRRPLQGGWR